MHPSIRWDEQDPLDELAVTTDTPWQLVKSSSEKKSASIKSNLTGFVVAKGTVSVVAGLSNKHKLDDNNTEQVNKRNQDV